MKSLEIVDKMSKDSGNINFFRGSGQKFDDMIF